MGGENAIFSLIINYCLFSLLFKAQFIFLMTDERIQRIGKESPWKRKNAKKRSHQRGLFILNTQ
jgi:hypothetical protein